MTRLGALWDRLHMVRTGKRANELASRLESAGLTRSTPPPRPSLDSLPAEAVNEFTSLYEDLGGLQASPVFRPGAWDLSFGDVVIELDEELHFNRYRAQTLGASWAAKLPWEADYARYCDDHEAECLSAGRWGKRWTNPSASRMFSGGEPGDFDGGSPRWKQRAIYDALKDVAALHSDSLQLARLSIYDPIAGSTLGTLLGGTQPVEPCDLRGLLDQRTISGS